MASQETSVTVDASIDQTEPDQTEPDPSLPFAALYANTYGDHTRAQWQRAWDHCIEHWLQSGRRSSEHTRRAYQSNIRAFQTYLADEHELRHLWLVMPQHVRAWLTYMRKSQSKESTISQRLSTLSSLYKYAIKTTTVIGGREVSLLVDINGNTRDSPFASASIERPKIMPYGNAVALPVEAYSWIIYDYQRRKPTVGNLRNLAMLLMFGLNGWSVNEVLSMQWQYIYHEKNSHIYLSADQGESDSGEQTGRPLPAQNYTTIVAYLSYAGRFYPEMPEHPDHIQGGDYIWQPVIHANRNNFGTSSKKLDHNRPVSATSANNVFRRSLVRYFRHHFQQQGLPPDKAKSAAEAQAKKYALQGLRHMVAQQFYAGSNNDLQKVQELMNHKNLFTTQVYLENMDRTRDQHSQILSHQLALNFPSSAKSDP